MKKEYGELQELIDAGAIPLVVDAPLSRDCPNCSGVQEIYVYKITGGPFKSPPQGEVGRGSRYIDYADHKPGWYTGKTKATPCPVCSGGSLVEYLKRMCGLEGNDLNITIKNFREIPGKAEGRKAAQNLLDMKLRPHGFITFWGSYGVGKSMLLKALVNGFRQRGLWAYYTSLADLLASVREKFGEGPGGVEAVLDDCRVLPVLCVDEVDRVNLTNWTAETVHRLLDDRFKAHGERLTVLASNLSPLQMPVEFGYLASRMRGGQVVEVGGADLRPAVALREKNT